MEMGFDCSIPYGDSSKYDFIVDLGKGELIRVQCKSSSNPLKKDGTRDTEAFQFYCVAQTTNTQKTTRHSYTSEDIDYFATYFQNNCYLIPVEECSTSKTLRFSPPQNGTNNYNKAEDYLFENMLSHKINTSFLKQKIEFTQSTVERMIFICSQCKKEEVYTRGGICHKCASFNRRVVDRPEREELKKMIREKSFLEIGRLYNVSDNSIRKWCDSYQLPTKKSIIKKYSNADWSKV